MWGILTPTNATLSKNIRVISAIFVVSWIALPCEISVAIKSSISDHTIQYFFEVLYGTNRTMAAALADESR